MSVSFVNIIYNKYFNILLLYGYLVASSRYISEILLNDFLT